MGTLIAADLQPPRNVEKRRQGGEANGVRHGGLVNKAGTLSGTISGLRVPENDFVRSPFPFSGSTAAPPMRLELLIFLVDLD
jgi:hypothetical protein